MNVSYKQFSWGVYLICGSIFGANGHSIAALMFVVMSLFSVISIKN